MDEQTLERVEETSSDRTGISRLLHRKDIPKEMDKLDMKIAYLEKKKYLAQLKKDVRDIESATKRKKILRVI